MQNVLKTNKKSADFFTWFEEAAQTNVAAAKLLLELCVDFADAPAMAERIHALEHQGDDISHRVYERLNRVFLPPLDREDVITLTSRLDDVVDTIHAAADAMYVYHVPGATPTARALAQVILACTEQVAQHLPALRTRPTMRGLQPTIIELHRLENQADELLRVALIDLFHNPHDPVEVLVWTRIYEMMEAVTDKSEDIADVLRSVVIKYA